jgi:hypothetical protein
VRLIRLRCIPEKGLSILFVNFTGRMARGARYVALSIILFGALALSLAISHDPREQTLVLERFAEQLEQVQRIHPDTEQFVERLIASFRQKPPTDKKLQQRQIAVINRIEAVLSDQTGALRQKKAARYSRNPSPPYVSGNLSDE